jgi:hypothetical protein
MQPESLWLSAHQSGTAAKRSIRLIASSASMGFFEMEMHGFPDVCEKFYQNIKSDR